MANADDVARPKRRLRRKAVPHYLEQKYGISLSEKTLAKWACTSSDGPPFHLFGRVPLYPEDELDAWVESRLGSLVRSTSEVGGRSKALVTAKRPSFPARLVTHTTSEPDALKAVPDE
jgi:hypothetical protein